MKERWRNINGYEGLYRISNMGRIKSINRYDNINRKIKEKILTPSKKNGYLFVRLSRDGLGTNFYIHRLVAIHFIPNPENKSEVNHLKTKDDVTVNDLEWSTHSENIIDSYKRGLNIPKKGIESHRFGITGKNHVSSKKINQIDLESGKIIKKWDSLHCITRAKGWNYKNISLCALNKRPTAYGYKWQYN